jgi:hypothetical protein
MRNVKEKIQIIEQTLKNYKKEVKELNEKLAPTSSSKVLAEREQQEALQVEVLQKEVGRVIQLFENTTQLCTTLEENDRIQQLD